MQLTAGTKNWANVEVRGVTGRGRLAPRLVFDLSISSPSESIETELRHMRVQVGYGGEVIGEGALVGQPVYWHGGSCQLEVPTDRRLLAYVTDGLGTGDGVSLTLRWQGVLRVLWSPTSPPSSGPMAGGPKAGEWTELRVAGGQVVELTHTIARSDWYSRCCSPSATTSTSTSR